MDWLTLTDSEGRRHLQAVGIERHKTLDRKPFQHLRESLGSLPSVPRSQPKIDGGVVRIGPRLATDHPARRAVRQFARAVMPWKKGPFCLLGEEIDAEWRSDYKWDRMAASLPRLAGQRILDVGCNNGYYLYRMLAEQPHAVLGIDPVPRCWYQFQLLQRFACADRLQMELWGWQEIGCFREVFDVIFCMGILYHHPDPIGLLRTLRQALRPGGTLILETIVIPGEEPHCLFPVDRYARMRNVWFLPTTTALENMLERTKFIDILRISEQPHRPEEQRTTDWNQGPSYRDFLDPVDHTQTIEGLPAPWRAIHIARRKP